MLKIKKNQRGMALVYTLILTTAILTFLAVSTKLSLDSLKNSKYELTSKTQVINVAQAGIQDAYFWFSRQDRIVKKILDTDFSDNAFNPRQSVDEKDRGDTDDSSVGIVRDIPIDLSLNLYGHYEVKKQISDNETGSNPNPDDPEAVHDISHKRYDTPRGSGSVWKIVSKGYVYIRKNLLTDGGIFVDKCCDKPNSKNIVLSKKTISAELQRLSLDVPSAAINITAGNINTNSFSRISGGSNGKGIRSATSTGNYTSLSSPILNGGYQMSDSTVINKLTPEIVFGVDRGTLKAIADIPIDDVSQLTRDKKYLSSFIFIDSPSVSFDSTNRLRGSGILFVKGNLTFANNSGSFFSGLIYIEDGDLNIGAGNTLSGSVIIAKNHNLTMSGSGDSATIEYNSGILDDVRKSLANYRINRLSFKSVK